MITPELANAHFTLIIEELHRLEADPFVALKLRRLHASLGVARLVLAASMGWDADRVMPIPAGGIPKPGGSTAAPSS